MQHPQAGSAVIVSGGVAHDFPATSGALAEVLGEVGIRARVRTDVEQALTSLDDPGGPGLVVLNLLRWSMQVERYAHLRDEWSLALSDDARTALLAHLRRGGGLLAVHGASICFDDWPGWREVLGGVWDWDRSSHPPVDDEPVTVTMTGVQHPVVEGMTDFSVVDEVYGFLDLAPDVVALMTSEHGGAAHPLLWAREVQGGRVVYDALGHDLRSYASPEHRTLLQRAARWATRAL